MHSPTLHTLLTNTDLPAEQQLQKIKSRILELFNVDINVDTGAGRAEEMFIENVKEVECAFEDDNNKERFAELAWDIALALVPHITYRERESRKHVVSLSLFEKCLFSLSVREALMFLISDALSLGNGDLSDTESTNPNFSVIITYIARIFMLLPVSSRYKHMGSVHKALIRCSDHDQDSQIVLLLSTVIETSEHQKHAISFYHGLSSYSVQLNLVERDRAREHELIHLHHFAFSLVLHQLEKVAFQTTHAEPNDIDNYNRYKQLLDIALILRPDVKYLVQRSINVNAVSDVDAKGLQPFSRLDIGIYLSCIFLLPENQRYLLIPCVYDPKYMLQRSIGFINTMLSVCRNGQMFEEVIRMAISLLIECIDRLKPRTLNELSVEYNYLLENMCVLARSPVNEPLRKQISSAFRGFVSLFIEDARFDIVKEFLSSPFSNISAYGAYLLKEFVCEVWESGHDLSGDGNGDSVFRTTKIMELIPLLFPHDIIDDHKRVYERLDHLHASLLFIQFLKIKGKWSAKDKTGITERHHALNELCHTLLHSLKKIEAEKEKEKEKESGSGSTSELSQVWMMVDLIESL